MNWWHNCQSSQLMSREGTPQNEVAPVINSQNQRQFYSSATEGNLWTGDRRESARPLDRWGRGAASGDEWESWSPPFSTGTGTAFLRNHWWEKQNGEPMKKAQPIWRKWKVKWPRNEHEIKFKLAVRTCIETFAPVKVSCQSLMWHDKLRMIPSLSIHRIQPSWPFAHTLIIPASTRSFFEYRKTLDARVGIQKRR